ncbi:MAG TPA: HNH endonuclease [Actinopolymorphaceae bacterium]|nr:HNH endonuclease [Actinopolymorphaceae bacterium]
MSERQHLPAGLADMPPGAELAAVLESLEVARLNGHDLVVVLAAQARQVAHLQAGMYASMAAIAHCPAGDADAPVHRTGGRMEFAADEIRAALTWTRRKADTELGLALRLAAELQPTWEYLHGGRIDLGRTWVINNATSVLDSGDDQGAAALGEVQDKILDYATTHTTGQVAAKLRRLILIADPEAAKKRYDDAIAQRRVVGQLNDDGSGNLHGINLPIERAAMARARIEAIAKAARLAGDIRTIDQIRADVYLDLLCGNNNTRGDSTSSRGNRDGDRGNSNRGSGNGDARGDGGASCRTSDDGTSDRGNRTSNRDRDTGTGNRGIHGGGGGGAAGGSAPTNSGAIVQLTVPISTLMGLAEMPGDLAGWGPVIADIARQFVHDHTSGQWRWVVTDPQTGTVIGADVTRRRPTAAQRRRAQAQSPRCRFVGCRMPAAHSDIDHIVRYADGGPTDEDNLGPLCRHDHRLKDQGGWTLHLPRPGTAQWTSPLGHTYLVHTEPPHPDDEPLTTAAQPPPRTPPPRTPPPRDRTGSMRR